jgi:hypothetical protein
MWNDEETLPHDLPDWMRQARQGVDWGLLLVLAFSLLAAWPFLIDPNLPQTNGSEQIIYQTTNIAASILEGRFYPRWSPHVLGELGAPIPNFYPPGPAYLAALIEVLLTNEPIGAARITYVLMICAAGIAVYALMLRRVNAAAGVLAAVLTVYSPYLAITAPHILGDLTAITITALVAALLWALDRLLMTRHPMDLATTTLLFAAMILTNPVAAIIGAAASLGYAIWLRQTTLTRFRIRAVWIPLILGIGAASFYWIPALLEQDTITWITPDVQAQPLEFRLLNLLAPPPLIDPEILRPNPQVTLGLIHALIAAGGMAGIVVSRRWRAIQGFFALTGLVAIGLTLTVLRAESWVVGLLSLCAAIVGSALPYILAKLPPARRRLILPILLILIWITCAPVWFVPASQNILNAVDDQAQEQHERLGYGVSVLAPGQPIPISVPPYNELLEAIIQQTESGQTNKLLPDSNSLSYPVSLLEDSTHTDRFQVRDLEQAVQLTVLTAYFPGWYARLDALPIPLWRDEQTGLIRVEVPNLPGSFGELQITLGTTPVRLGSWIIAWADLGVLTLLVLRRIRTERKRPFNELRLLPMEDIRLIALPLASFVLVTLLFATGLAALPLRITPGSEFSSAYPITYRSDSGLTLTGFRLSSQHQRPGAVFDLDLFWQTQRFLTENYRVRVVLVNNRDGSRWAETSLRHPGYYPTRRWNTTQTVIDHYTISLPTTIIPGNYQIQVEAVACQEDCTLLTPLNFFTPTGRAAGFALTLPTLIQVQP